VLIEIFTKTNKKFIRMQSCSRQLTVSEQHSYLFNYVKPNGGKARVCPTGWRVDRLSGGGGVMHWGCKPSGILLGSVEKELVSPKRLGCHSGKKFGGNLKS
jgi:hypothetical protein